MHRNIFSKLSKGFSIFWKNFLSAYPVIIFFVVLFLITVSMFSLQYAMVVSIFTTMFNIQRRRQNSIGNFIKIFFISIFLCLLAFLTTVNPVYCLILNFCIPFLLVFLQSSRFNPKGYFSYAMLFIFLELMPVPASELPRELTAVMFSVGFLVAALVLYTLIFHPSSKKELDIRFGLKELADVLEQLAEGNADYKTRGRLLDLEHKFHLTAYNNHKFIPVHNSHTKLYDMFSILFQRAAYLVHDTAWRTEMDAEHIRELQELAEFLRYASQNINTRNNDPLIRQARVFLNEMKDADGRLRIFFRSFLHMLILIFRYITTEDTIGARWNKICWAELSVHIKRICSLESLEMRFALRFSIIMTAGCAVNAFVNVTHAYWIPLNAFLLLQPDYEESAHRMKTRPIGTIIGCCVEYLVYPLLPGIGWKLLFAVAMLCLMYCATPGTWNHPIFSTCYALTLASMTMNETLAIELRVVYLLLAVLLVFVVNRFFFPTRRETQFRCNIKELLRLHNSYWELIKESMTHHTDISVSSEILSLFHMTYEQAVNYIKKPGIPFDPEYCRQVMLTLWHMFSELEQIEYLLQTNSIDRKCYPDLYHIADRIQKQIYPSCTNLAWDDLRLQDLGEDLSYVLEQYMKNAKRLIQLHVTSLYPKRYRLVRS